MLLHRSSSLLSNQPGHHLVALDVFAPIVTSLHELHQLQFAKLDGKFETLKARWKAFHFTFC